MSSTNPAAPINVTNACRRSGHGAASGCISVAIDIATADVQLTAYMGVALLLFHWLDWFR